MPDRIVTKTSCSECGSEALDQALFCFHCGAPLAAETDSEAVADTPIEAPPGDPFDDVPEPPPPKKVSGKGRKTKKRRGLRETEDPVVSGSAVVEPGVMRMRRIETRWNSGDDAPNIWFFVVSGAVFVIAFLIFLLSMYLR